MSASVMLRNNIVQCCRFPVRFSVYLRFKPENQKFRCTDKPTTLILVFSDQVICLFQIFGDSRRRLIVRVSRLKVSLKKTLIHLLIFCEHATTLHSFADEIIFSFSKFKKKLT